MPEENKGLASTASAFATYSLVPYLGILFCPGAVFVGGLGVVRSYRNQAAAQRSACYLSILVGSVVLVVQCILWWILYKVPGWTNGL